MIMLISLIKIDSILHSLGNRRDDPQSSCER